MCREAVERTAPSPESTRWPRHNNVHALCTTVRSPMGATSMCFENRKAGLVEVLQSYCARCCGWWDVNCVSFGRAPEHLMTELPKRPKRFTRLPVQCQLACLVYLPGAQRCGPSTIAGDLTRYCVRCLAPSPRSVRRSGNMPHAAWPGSPEWPVAPAVCPCSRTRVCPCLQRRIGGWHSRR